METSGIDNTNRETSAKDSTNLEANEKIYAYLRIYACFLKLQNLYYENGNLVKLKRLKDDNDKVY